MNEQRIEAYVNLVQQLLDCTDGEELVVLLQHAELLDGGLLAVMAQRADLLEQQGNQNAAAWLQQFAQQLAERLHWCQLLGKPFTLTYPRSFLVPKRSVGLHSERLSLPFLGSDHPISSVTRHNLSNEKSLYFQELQLKLTLMEEGTPIAESSMQEPLTFLGEVLQLLTDSQGDVKQVYSFLAEHQHQLNDTLLQTIPMAAFSLLNGDTNQLAFAAAWFGYLIASFPLGKRGLNLELAIAAYQLALQVRTREAFPEQWATTQNNLAGAYTNRIRGDRADNLEHAIAAYELALQVRTREAFPQDWAATQYNLALVYSLRIRGDRADNLELAIAAYQLALQAFTREAFPEQWATTQYNLAIAYTDHIRGDRADNLEQAIAAYQLALQVRTLEAFPQDWTATQHNLAIAYTDRIRGDRADNLEQAIAAYELALSIRTREAFPLQWAMTQNNLVIAYTDRIRGNRADNLEQAIAASQLALQVRTREAFPQDWAVTQNNLANVYIDRIRGDRADNLEQAIAAYELALQVYSREAIPQDWATTQNNLANAYSYRIRGDRTDNLEQAIAAYELALQVYSREAFPQDWATTQYNLANAYDNRIRGDRADNLEQAIAAYELALQVYSRKAFPQNWAATQNNLAIAYTERIRGDRANNLEQAIAASQLALQVRTREAFPQDWAATQNNLANVYIDRIRGDRTDNLEQAIAVYQLALQVRTREAFPQDWAATQNNLANVYIDRIRGDRADNLEQAIAAYQLALQVRTLEAFPQDWAATQHNLANAYDKRIRGDRADNLEQAIAAYQLALQVRTREVFPEQWAMTQNNLANVYRKRIRGDRADNLEQAIVSYQLALQVRTREVFPQDWAATQYNLALAYTDPIRGDRADNLEQAIASYQLSLEIYRPELFPNSCRRVARDLGDLYFDQQRWIEATFTYQQALQAAEALYQSALFLDSQTAELSETSDLHHRAAYALAKAGELRSAVLTLEQGRARGLSDTLAREHADLEQLQTTAPNVYTCYYQAATKFRQLEDQQRTMSTLSSSERYGITPDYLRQQVSLSRQELNVAIAAIRQVPGYSDFLNPLDFTDIISALPHATPLVYLVTTTAGGLALIVTPQIGTTGISSATVHPLWLKDLSHAFLLKLLLRWFAAYYQQQENRPAWFAAIDQCTGQLWKHLMSPLIQHLSALNYHKAILIPTGYLGLLPLHAAWTGSFLEVMLVTLPRLMQQLLQKLDLKLVTILVLDHHFWRTNATTPTGRYYALDAVHFTYAPNARSLKTAQIVASRIIPDSLLAIDEPNHTEASPLPNSQREIDTAIATFPHHLRLSNAEATSTAVLAALPHHTVLHFSCHGFANLEEPLNSGLALANKDILTLHDIFSLKLTGVRLAVLSACETGLPGIDLPDEVISLPIGLLQAGVAGVAASLWSVSDLSTMLLMTRFYDLWRIKGLEISQALRQAQQWVRDSTNGEKAAYFKISLPEFATNVRIPAHIANFLYQKVRLSNPNARNFHHPFHWAAFQYVGV